MRMSSVLISVVILAATTATAAENSSASKTAAMSVRQLMLAMVKPTSDVVWAVPGKPPTTEDEWEVVVANAMVLAEAGSLLNSPNRALDRTTWITDAQAFRDSALRLAISATERNVDKISDDGNALYDTCDACHKKYMAARNGR